MLSTRRLKALAAFALVAGAPGALADEPPLSAAVPPSGKEVAHPKGIEPEYTPPSLRGPGPVNDLCTGALPIAIGGSVMGDTTGAVADTVPCAGAGTTSPGIWYTFVGNGDQINASTCGGAAWDTVLRILSGSCAALTCIAYNDDACGLQSTTPTFTSVNGQTYYIYISGFGSSAGAFTLTLNDVGPPPPPVPNCANAPTRTLPFVENGDTTGATPDQPGVPACGPGATTPPNWFRFLGSGNIVRATTCGGAAWDTVLSIYTGGCGALLCHASNDDNCGLQSRVDFPTVAGQEYWVEIRGFSSTAFGPYTLTVGDLPPPCQITPPGNAVMENEPDCGLPADTVNGGCNSAPPVFSTIACGVPVFGSGAYDTSIGFRDTDWYLFDLPQDDAVTITVRSEFPSIFGPIGDAAGPIMYTGDPATWCPLVAQINPFVLGVEDCNEYSVTVNLTAGTWAFFVGAQFAQAIACGTNGDYLVTITTGAGCGGADCNMNGIDDAVEIAGNAALDCYNPAVVQSPHVIGGPDGALDSCQCQGNFNRDAAVNSNDISTLLTAWLAAVQAGNANADINCSGSTNSTDISAFLTIWLAQVNNVDPNDGCP